ncbi:MAG: NAD-binding protein, partial [Gammaproteobacteria bacterium]|nr:NAD-binding protein [Gammaproteobacteria bacterium]
MNQVIFLILRRMRLPLVMLVITYAISILGLVLIPGIDDTGKPWHMDFFHAFYFVTYMATTIGFGELPYEFTDGQRMWVLVTIYMTVTAWLYAIGKILSLVQDAGFKQAVTEQVFQRNVRHVSRPFYIICGYGDTGRILLKSLIQRRIQAVVIDSNQNNINLLELEDLGLFIPGLCADARRVETLKEAGLKHRNCLGVLALTDHDETNLKIAITTKLLEPGIKVICRAETHDAADNMASFGTDHIINAFDIFAQRLALALHSPGAHILYDWLTGVPNEPLMQPLEPPRGMWVVCGYGRFGQAVCNNLLNEGIEVSVIEANPEIAGELDQCVVGRGTEADTLLSADIERAVGIVAGTDNDANNLSIIMTAGEINPDLYMVARQNRQDNQEIFEAALPDLVMHRSEIIARDIFTYLTNPFLIEFLQRALRESDEWINLLVSRLVAIVGTHVPELHLVTVDQENSPGIIELFSKSEKLSIKDLVRDSRDREQSLPIIVLLRITKSGEVIMTPEEGEEIEKGDRLLMCGSAGLGPRIDQIVRNYHTLSYLHSGTIETHGWLLRRIF